MADYHTVLTDEFWCEHDGQSRILDPHKVADEIERLRKDNDILRQVLGYMKVVSEPETSVTAAKEQR